MAKCQLSGKGPQSGNHRPWSRKATRRQWQPNVQQFTLYVPELGRRVKIRASASAMRTVNKIGLSAYLQKNQLSLKDLT
ncbi:MAG: 50S ribosomal protein L28 [Caldilineaceae bacterium]|nr:50S ribosomal protein L28 [Caldilineaceae bacterium]